MTHDEYKRAKQIALEERNVDVLVAAAFIANTSSYTEIKLARAFPNLFAEMQKRMVRPSGQLLKEMNK